MNEINSGRRGLVGMLVMGATLPAHAKVPDAVLQENDNSVVLGSYPVRLFNIHTQEHLVIQLSGVGYSKTDTQNKTNHFLRDHRQNAECLMDMQLMQQLQRLQSTIGGNQIFEVICGYRTKATNDLLRRKSGGVAKKSYHLHGRAIDVRLRETPIRQLRDAAVAMRAGGVGYYPKSNFIHLDTGPVRYWGQK